MINIDWEKVINENREELLKDIKSAYEKAIRRSGTVAGDYYYQVEIDHNGFISTNISNGGGSVDVRVRDGNVILVFLGKIPELEEGNLLPDDLCYHDYIVEEDWTVIQKLIDENDLSEEEAIRVYDESLISKIHSKLREEAIKRTL